METFLLSNNEENTECSAPPTAEAIGDSPLNNCVDSVESPRQTPIATMETHKKLVLKLCPGGKKKGTSGKLLKTMTLTNTHNSESENVDRRHRQKDDPTTNNFASKGKLIVYSDHISVDPIEIRNTLLSSDNIRTEGENLVAVTETRESGGAEIPDHAPEQKSVEQKQIKCDRKRKISSKHFSREKKTNNGLHSNMQISFYQCPHCDYNISEKYLLKQHMRRRHTEPRYKCDFCMRKFQKKSPLYGHILQHLGEKRYFCTYCKHGFLWKCKLNEHVLQEHVREKPFQCEVCDKIFLSKKTLERHKYQHVELKLHYCPVCQKAFASKYSKRKHISRMHVNTVRYKCDICNKFISNKWNLKSHIYLHLKRIEDPFKCKTCNVSFFYNWQLKKHMLWIHSDSKPYECNICKKGFVSKCRLEKHYRLKHMSANSYKCELCQKIFMKKGNLKRHIYQHLEEELQNNYPVFQKAFSQNRSVQQDVSIAHNYSKRYKCDICAKNFSKYWHIQRHIYSHFKLSDSTFTCKTCKESFYSNWNLKRHLRTLAHRNNLAYNLKKSVMF